MGVLFILLMVFMSSPGFATSDAQATPSEISTLDATDSALSTSANGVPIEIKGNATKLQIQAGNVTRLRIQDKLQVNLSLQDNCELQVNVSDANPAGPLPQNMYQYRSFYQFELSQATQLQANFQMALNQSQLPADVTPEQLSWAYYNTYTHQWQYVHSWLNEEKNMLSTETNHFSTWTILQQPQNESVATIAMQGNGTMVKMNAQQQYQVKLQSKFQVNVSFGEDIEMSINETDVVPFEYTFENHYRLGNVWMLETNNSQVQLNATFGFPYDPSLIPGDAKQEQLKFYFFNTTRNQWQVANSWVNTEQHMIYAESNHFSTWTIFVEKNKPLEPSKDGLNEVQANGTPMMVENGNTYQFKTQYGFQLNLSLGTTAELSMNESTTHQYQNQVTAERGIGKYLSLELNETGVAIQATLAYKVASSEVPTGADPLQLQFAYYNTVTNQWEVQNSWVEKVGSDYMVYANTTHFSTWTILASETSATTSSSTSTATSSAPGFEILSILGLLVLLPIIKKKH